MDQATREHLDNLRWRRERYQQIVDELALVADIESFDVSTLVCEKDRAASPKLLSATASALAQNIDELMREQSAEALRDPRMGDDVELEGVGLPADALAFLEDGIWCLMALDATNFPYAGTDTFFFRCCDVANCYQDNRAEAWMDSASASLAHASNEFSHVTDALGEKSELTFIQTKVPDADLLELADKLGVELDGARLGDAEYRRASFSRIASAFRAQVLVADSYAYGPQTSAFDACAEPAASSVDPGDLDIRVWPSLKRLAGAYIALAGQSLAAQADPALPATLAEHYLATPEGSLELAGTPACAPQVWQVLRDYLGRAGTVQATPAYVKRADYSDFFAANHQDVAYLDLDEAAPDPEPWAHFCDGAPAAGAAADASTPAADAATYAVPRPQAIWALDFALRDEFCTRAGRMMGFLFGADTTGYAAIGADVVREAFQLLLFERGISLLSSEAAMEKALTVLADAKASVKRLARRVAL